MPAVLGDVIHSDLKAASQMSAVSASRSWSGHNRRWAKWVKHHPSRGERWCKTDRQSVTKCIRNRGSDLKDFGVSKQRPGGKDGIGRISRHVISKPSNAV